MNSLIVSSRFAAAYESLQKRLPQSLLLTGPKGVGLGTIARSLTHDSSALVLAPIQLTKSSTTAQISTEMIRDLYDHVRTDRQRIVIIDDADTMTPSAQNSLLKLLEEPNPSTTFILTSHHPEMLLATIRSRVTAYHVPLTDGALGETEELQTVDEAKRRQLLFLAKGKPAELHRLLQNASYFEMVASETTIAKKLVSATPYDRSVAIATIKADREVTLRVIERAIDLLERSPSGQSLPMIETLADAYSSIRRGGNTKLQLLRAML